MESRSTESATAESKDAALAELRACRTHLATEEATRSRLGYLQLAKNGPTATEADQVFAELAHAKFCNPRRIAVSWPAPTESVERRKQREQAAAARKAAATAAAADKVKAKGVWEPTQVGPHLGLIVDLQRGEFRAPEEKLVPLAKVARSLLGHAASNMRWLPARQLASFAGKAQFLYVAITPARFFSRDLHCVLATRQGWGGRVKMTNQLRRDLEWWTQVPAHHNGRSMYMHVETAYLHADSSSYGWELVLNNNNAYDARGFWYEDDRAHHITWKELRAVRHAVESFLPQPIAAVPEFVDLRDWYTISRDAYRRRFYGASPPPKFWSISPRESSATWSVSATLTEWLRQA
eukprot:jgi/Tetstr1/434666/TSEL_023757.t1